MGYIINEIKTVDTVNDGNVLVVKVYPIRSNSADNFGTNIAFAFPYSEQLFTQLSQISNNHKIWEPNEEDFVEDIIEVKNGDVMEVYKSIDLIPEVSIDDVIPLDPFLLTMMRMMKMSMMMNMMKIYLNLTNQMYLRSLSN